MGWAESVRELYSHHSGKTLSRHGHLLEWAEAVEDAAVGQDGLHAHHGAVQVAVPDEPEPAGVGGDVAADVAAALGPSKVYSNMTSINRLN